MGSRRERRPGTALTKKKLKQVMEMKLAVLYTDAGKQRYDLLACANPSMTRQDLLDEYVRNNPGVEIRFAFDLGDDLVERALEESREFGRYAVKYGFRAGDYKTRFVSDGRTFEFVGFRPKRRKYVCRIRDVAAGTDLVCTADFVRMRLMGARADSGGNA